MIAFDRHRIAILGFACSALVACAHSAYVPTDADAPPLPYAEYRDAARKGGKVYRIDPQQSRVFIRVGRDGPMKSAGHDHVIASEDVEGLVLVGDDSDASRADLRLPLQRLVVDKAEYRERFGLKAGVPESAVNGTTRNMQDKVLQSGLHPWAEVRARFADDSKGSPVLAVTVTAHGTAQEFLVPVSLSMGPDRLEVSGAMTVQHSDFGLTVFSAAGGLLRVAEQIEIEFELSADRWAAPDETGESS